MPIEGWLSQSRVLKKLPLLAAYLAEFWMDEAGIDANVWASALGGAGTITWTAGFRHYILLNCPTAGGGDTVRLRSVQRWALDPPGTSYFNANGIAKKVNLEFEFNVSSVANIDNAVSIIGGFTTGAASTRATNSIIAFILVADVLNALTDNAGAETVTAITGLTLSSYNKLRIEVTGGAVRFYVNEVLRATHTTNLPPTQVNYLQFYIANEATGTAAMYIGPIRCWIGDEPY